MRKRLIYIIIATIFFLLGAIGTIIIIKKYPVNFIKTITEENVTVTDTGIASSVNKIKDAVVVVQNYKGSNLKGTGSGFVYKTEGNDAYILTNHHVIDNADTIKITYSDDSETNAKLIASDEYADIAVLKVDKDTIKGIAQIGKNDDMSVGDTVFTVGNPMGIDYKGTVTRGILSGKDRMVTVSISGTTNDWIMNVMQTDAAINPGNSGGPLCNVNGEVIGINSIKISQTQVEGIGFSIPIEDALTYAESLIENGKINRPYIGVSMINASSVYLLAYSGIRIDSNLNYGVVVSSVENSSPAANSGLQKGDVIIKVDNEKVSNIAEFRYRLYSHSADETVKLTINRDGKEKTIEVKLGSN